MVAKTDITLEEAIGKEKHELALLTLRYTQVMKRLVDSAKIDPKFSPDSWGSLAEFVDTKTFERVGTWKEVVRWPNYTRLLTDWALRSEWYPRVRRVTEHNGVVFLELSEVGKYAQMTDSIYSMSVYEYNTDKKLHRLDIYMQRENVPLPSGTWEINRND
jgi:hypothetical protein